MRYEIEGRGTIPKIKIGDIAEVTKLTGFEFTKYIKYVEDGEIIALRALNLRNGELDLSDIKRIKREVSESLTRSKLYKNDILLTYTGNSYGDCAIVDENDKYHLAPNICKISVDTTKVVPYYMYIMIRNDAFRELMKSYIGGSGQPTIPMKIIRTLELPIPDLSIQRKIVSIIKDYDDRIRVNKRINDNLEQQAMMLLADSTSDVQKTVEIGQLMSFENGYAFQSKTYLSEGKFRIITIKNVQDGVIDSQGAVFINEIPSRMKAGCFLHEGDVLLSLTGNIGRVGIVCEKNLLLNQRVAKFVPKDSFILPWLYYFFRLHSTKVSLETIAKGTAQLNLSPVETLNIQIPFEMSSAKKISGILWPMFNREIANNMESLRLAELRDSLLFRIISGEIDVSKVVI